MAYTLLQVFQRSITMKLSPHSSGGTVHYGNTMPRELNTVRTLVRMLITHLGQNAQNVYLSILNCLGEFKQPITMLISLFHGKASCC